MGFTNSRSCLTGLIAWILGSIESREQWNPIGISSPFFADESFPSNAIAAVMPIIHRDRHDKDHWTPVATNAARLERRNVGIGFAAA